MRASLGARFCMIVRPAQCSAFGTDDAQKGRTSIVPFIERPAAIRLMGVPGKMPVTYAKGWTPS